MKKLVFTLLLAGGLLLAGCATPRAVTAKSEPQLLRVAYHSAMMNADRDYFVYLPPNFQKQDEWPVILFLHGNGERGDDKSELDHVLTTYRGDPKRVYLTGLSSGGTGTWVMAAEYPDRFAAIAPVVGFGSPSLAPHWSNCQFGALPAGGTAVPR